MAPRSDSPSKSLPTMKTAVKAALKSSESTKGMSLTSIKIFINEKYPEMAQNNRFRLRLKKCLLKGLETGLVTRPKMQSGMTGVNGSFKLAVTEKAKTHESRSRSPGGPKTEKKGRKRSASSKSGDRAKEGKGKKRTQSASADHAGKKDKKNGSQSADKSLKAKTKTAGAKDAGAKQTKASSTDAEKVSQKAKSKSPKNPTKTAKPKAKTITKKGKSA